MSARIAFLIVAVAAVVICFRTFRPQREAAPPRSAGDTQAVSPPLSQPLPTPEPPTPSAAEAPAVPDPESPKATNPTSPMATATAPVGSVTEQPKGASGSPEQVATDLDQLALSLRDYRTVMIENPVGNNAEITSALMGENRKGARLAPTEARVNEGGQMVDRWGTPYFFHQMSATVMEIHSAGPDKKMGTDDDIIHR